VFYWEKYRRSAGDSCIANEPPKNAHWNTPIVVSEISDVKVMSSTVTVIFAITRVVNNYNIRTKPCFLNQTEPNSFRTKSKFSHKPNRNWTKIKNISHTSLLIIQIMQIRSFICLSYTWDVIMLFLFVKCFRSLSLTLQHFNDNILEQ